MFAVDAESSERDIPLVKANKNAQMLSRKRMREKSEPGSLGPQ
jgi:hypothetical protein